LGGDIAVQNMGDCIVILHLLMGSQGFVNPIYLLIACSNVLLSLNPSAGLFCTLFFEVKIEDI